MAKTKVQYSKKQTYYKNKKIKKENGVFQIIATWFMKINQ